MTVKELAPDQVITVGLRHRVRVEEVVTQTDNPMLPSSKVAICGHTEGQPDRKVTIWCHPSDWVCPAGEALLV